MPLAPSRLRRRALLGAAAIALALAAAAGFWVWSRRAPDGGAGSAPAGALSGEPLIRAYCSRHHAFPAPELFEKRVWVKEIERMYLMAPDPVEGGIGVPPRDEALAYYQSRAPAAIEPVRGQGALGPGSLRLRKKAFTPRGAPPTPAVASVRLLPLTDPPRLDLIFCDMRHGQVALQRLYREDAPVARIAEVPHPCHAEPADLDRDGILDLLIANLGSFEPYDHHRGSVVWLRGTGGGRFTALTLAQGLPRVADVQAADLDGDGDVDLAVAAFGFRKTGEVLYLENRTTDWTNPNFHSVTLDRRPGAISVPIVDLDRDGRADIVVLLAQQFESVEVLLNRGAGAPFEPRVIWAAPHPAWGCTGIDLADLDADGDLDVLLANGDTLDHSQLVPWQGARWLENRGEYPFVERFFMQLPGCHRAQAVDLDLDGDLDAAACSFLPQFPMERARRPLGLESLLWLEQTSRGEFARHSLEIHACDYPTIDAGDLDADGDPDLVLGNYALSPEVLGTIKDWITVFENLKR